MSAHEQDEADAELIRNCRTLVAMEAEWRALPGDEAFSGPRQDGYHALIDFGTDTPALTDAGNRAKLAVAVSFFEPDPPDERSIVDGLLWDAITALATNLSGHAERSVDPAGAPQIQFGRDVQS